MADRGSFKVQSEALRDHAAVWDSHSANVAEAATSISSAVGKGADFGWIASENGVDDYFNTWISAMSLALADAGKTFDYLFAALNSVADDYDGTDATVAADINALDRLNDLER